MRQPLLGSCLLCLLFVPACSTGGPKGVKATGQLLYKGQPYIANHKGSINVRFTPIAEGDGGDYYIADVKREDGTFIVKGRAGETIPAGQYRISIEQMAIDAPPELETMNALFTPKESKIIRDVGPDTSLRIDLAHPEGK